MKIKQISVFLENKAGRINDVTKTLAKHNIEIHAFSIAEAKDFGLLHLIVSDVDKAIEELRAENFAVKATDVVCIDYPSSTVSLTAILDYLATEQVFIEYMYACQVKSNTYAIIRTEDVDKCLRALKKFK